MRWSVMFNAEVRWCVTLMSGSALDLLAKVMLYMLVLIEDFIWSDLLSA